MVSSSLQRRFGCLTAADAARLDAAAVAGGVAIAQLMEVAGFQVARCAWRLLHHRPGRVHVVAGSGNNGGDGLVASRHLAGWGCEVSVAVLCDAARAGDLLRRQADAAAGAAVRVTFTPDPGDVLDGAATATLVVDALLGTGLSRPPRSPHADVIEALRGIVLSVDVPSGMDATTGGALGPAVRARMTCTLAAVKSGLWEPAARPLAGEVVAADIGMPRPAWRSIGVEPPTSLRGGRLVTVPL